jgi:hypothetical protein
VDYQDLLKKPPQDALWDRKPAAAPATGPPLRAAMPATPAAAAAPAEAGMSPEELARIADRKQAQADLAPLFDVVSGDHEGELLPNQVTQAEYEKLCNNYSDIRTGNSNLKIDAGKREGEEAEAFRNLILGDIQSIMQTAAGRELVERLATAADPGGEAHTTTILGAESPGMARAGPATRNESTKHWLQNGIGTSMNVRYAPGEDVTREGAVNPWFPMRSDVVLFHELVHAMHGVEGDMAPGLVEEKEAAPGDEVLPGGVRIEREEYATVGLGDFTGDPRYAVNENAYRGERRALAGQRGERAGDDSWAMERRTSYLTSTPADVARDEEELRKLRAQGKV